jgi:hypothetical protein
MPSPKIPEKEQIMESSTSTRRPVFLPDLEAVNERVREANERFAEAGRKVTSAYLDGFERYITGVAQFERRLGEQTQLEPLASFLSAHAQMTEDVTKASVSAARELVAA